MSIVGVCGYGFTGSAAVIDLLKEYEECKYIETNGRTLELSFSYEPDGLLDLEYHLMKQPVKHLSGDAAITRFIKLSRWNSKSMDRVTNGRYSVLTKKYIESITQVKYRCFKAEALNNSTVKIFVAKCLGFLQSKLENKFHKYIPLRKESDRYISVYPEAFYKKTKQYVSDILMSTGAMDNEHLILLDQPFPPNKPESVFHFFDDPYAIIVNRDPRDIYVIVKHLRFSTGKFIPHDNVEDFVNYYRSVVQYESIENNRVMRIQFEDLIYKYDETVMNIEKYLGIKRHVLANCIFKPEESIKNTNMRNLFPEDEKEMLYIEKELKEFLYPFERYDQPDERDGIFELAAR